MPDQLPDIEGDKGMREVEPVMLFDDQGQPIVPATFDQAAQIITLLTAISVRLEAGINVTDVTPPL